MKKITALLLLALPCVALASDSITREEAFDQIAALVSVRDPAIQDNTQAVHTVVNRVGNYNEFVGEAELLRLMVQSCSYLCAPVSVDYTSDGYVFEGNGHSYAISQDDVDGQNYEHVAVQVTTHLL